MAEQTIAKQKSRWRFTLRDVLWLIALIGLCLAWWGDHRRLTSRVDLFELQVAQLKEAARSGFAFAANTKKPESRFETAADFVSFVETGTEYYELNSEAKIFSGNGKAADAVPGLVQLLSNASPDIRRRAVYALLYIHQRPELSVPKLIELLDDTAEPTRERGSSVQWAAAQTLGALKAQEALPKLREKMMDDECQIAANAARTIHIIDRKAVIGPRMIELCTNKHRANRWDAVHDLAIHVDAKTASLVLAEAFEATDPSDKEMREFVAFQMNRVAKSDQ